MRDPSVIKAFDPERDLRAHLRGYQRAGTHWLWFMTRLGLGACLADDMGLGKTIQTLALLLQIKREASSKNTRPSLLVVPASLLANWKDEIARFAPSLNAFFLHPSETPPETLQAAADHPVDGFSGKDLVITTYGLVTRLPWLRQSEWRLVVLDEAQAIKNRASRQTRAVKELRAPARIALTGTPVENRPGDLWSLFDFICPGLLGSATEFGRMVKRLSDDHGRHFAPLRALTRPYILRRLKTDRSIIADLPEKTEVALRGADHRELITAATESVTANGSSTADISDALSGEDLSTVFGIEIESLETAPKSKPPKPRARNDAARKPKKTPALETSPAKTSRDKRRGKAQPKKDAKASAKKKSGGPARRSRTK
jgi:hypothetical protein